MNDYEDMYLISESQVWYLISEIYRLQERFDLIVSHAIKVPGPAELQRDLEDADDGAEVDKG